MQKLTILIVDDSLLIVNKTKELLKEVVCITTIVSCSTYAKAIELLDRHQPQLALLDINLPDKSGIDLLKHIKAFFPDTGAIMVTNQNDDFYKDYSLQLGADHYVDKSKDFEKLSVLVASYC